MRSDASRMQKLAYVKDTYNQLALRFKKDDYVLNLLDIACKVKNVTKNEYVRSSLIAQFERDEITLDMVSQLKMKGGQDEIQSVDLNTLTDGNIRFDVFLSLNKQELYILTTLNEKKYIHREQISSLSDNVYFHSMPGTEQNNNGCLVLEMKNASGGEDKRLVILDSASAEMLNKSCSNLFNS